MSPISAAPKDKLTELTGEINRLRTAACLDEIAIARCKIEAHKLKIDVPSDGLSILGMIACLEGEYGKMRKFHEDAIRYAPGDPLFLSHYASSLERAGYLEEAFTYAGEAFGKDSSDTIALEILVDCSDMLGLEEDHVYYLEKLKKVAGDKVVRQKIDFREDDPKFLQGMLDCLDKEIETKNNFIRIDDDEFARMLELADDIEAPR